MCTYQLTPKVAVVPTQKAQHHPNETFSALFNQSIFVQCEKVVSDDEIFITLRDSSFKLTLSIEPIGVPTEAAYA